MVFYIITEEATTLSWNSTANSSWPCSGLCMMPGGPCDFGDREAELPPAQNGQGYDGPLDRIFFHVDQQM